MTPRCDDFALKNFKCENCRSPRQTSSEMLPLHPNFSEEVGADFHDV